jgi:hypothetical protein
MPRSDHAVLLKATAEHGRRETTCGLPVLVPLLPATKGIARRLLSEAYQSSSQRSMPMIVTSGISTLQKKDDLLNCWTSSSDISGYYADFHEGHGTVGAWHGRGMGTACYV